MENMISVLLVEPEKRPKVIQMENELKVMQNLVGGYIEASMPFEDEVALVCNENGKNEGLSLNRAIYFENSDEIADIIKEAENELISEAKEYRTFSGGIMIENPEAVKNINRLINKTDFVSIETNDLKRYTLKKNRNKPYTLTKHEAKKIIDIIIVFIK